MSQPAVVITTTLAPPARGSAVPAGLPLASGLTTSRAADPSLPLRYMVTGLLFAVAAFGLALAYAPSFLDGVFLTPHLLAVTHLTALGWLTMIAMGALYQFVPVVLDVPIFSERLGKVQFYLYLAGVLGLAYEIGAGRLQTVAWPAGLLVLAIGLFLYNMARTLARVERWPLTGWFIIAALTSLGLVVTAGFVLALNLILGFLPLSQLAFVEAHGHLAALGWLGLLVMGVSYKLTPMFALSHPFDEWRLGRPVFILMTASVAGLFVSLLLRLGTVPLLACWLVAATGTGLYAWDYATMLRVRRRRPIDLTQQHNIGGICGLLLATLLGLALVLTPSTSALHPRLQLAYAVMALAGWLGLTTLGQLYKIVPFLVWTHRFAPKMGKERVPLLKDLYPLPLARGGFMALVAGLVLAVAGILSGLLPLVQGGFGLCLAGATIAASNLIRVVLR
jgi:cbb3-type cytochrome oxidase subunit 1